MTKIERSGDQGIVPCRMNHGWKEANEKGLPACARRENPEATRGWLPKHEGYVTSKHRERVRRRLADETGRIHKEAPRTIALLYPSPYAAAMSSLGYQRIYRAVMEAPGLACERVVLDDEAETDLARQSRPTSYESGRELAEFPIIA